MDWITTMIRLGLALVLTIPIGWERESAQKPAGLRTHMLVALGCCLFTLVSIDIAADWGSDRADPGRIAAQVVTGIGFLGGGAILRGGGEIRGLTTAASIWSVAAVGMACGSGYYAGAAVGALSTFVILTLVERWERSRAAGPSSAATLRFRFRSEESLERARESLVGLGFRPVAMEVDRNAEGPVLVVKGEFTARVISLAFRELSEDGDFVAMDRQQDQPGRPGFLQG